jgi:ribose transport system substrate-binding protein
MASLIPVPIDRFPETQLMCRGSLRGFCILVALFLVGCGGPLRDRPGEPSVSAKRSSDATDGVKFVGFDASSRLVEAIKEGKLQGTVVQNPLRMGALGVKTLVDHLEKKAVEPKIPTGETMVTPENLSNPDIALLVNPQKASNSENASVSGPKSKKYRIMVIPKGTTHEFWQSIHAGALKAAEELGNVELIWQGPQKEDERSDQIKLVQNAVAVGVDGIVLAPLDAKALVEPVERAIAKGIPVVIIDSGLDSNKIVSYVATDNYHGGVLAAQRLGDLLKGRGRIILLRYAVGSASTEEREKGFTDTLQKEFPNITYLSDDQYAGATSDLAQQKSQNLITRFRGQIDGVFCPNESSTLGMLRALDGAGLLGRRQ